MISHAQMALPNESCGLLGGKAGRVHAVYPGANAEHSPVRFRMDPQDQLRAMNAIKLAGGDILGIFHSHPSGQVIPSPTDLAQAYYRDAVYVILASQRSGEWQMRGYNLAMGRNRNVIRAVGMGAGLATTLLDLVKGALPIWMVKLILPDSPWAKVELQVEP